MTFYPKRPVKSFQDLEIYQKSLALTAEIFKRLEEEYKNSTDDPQMRSDLLKERAKSERLPSQSEADQTSQEVNPFLNQKQNLIDTLLSAVLELPKLMAKGHGLRFAEPPSAVKTMEEAMLDCNKIVVYLELYRDLCNKIIEFDFFDEAIGSYLALRFKILHLIKSWERIEKSYAASLPPRQKPVFSSH